MSKSTSEPKNRSLPKVIDQRLEIFKQLKSVLSKYSPPLVATSDFEGRYELVSKRAVEFMGRKKTEIYFGAAIIQGNYVGLYLMHVYVKPERLQNIAPELKKLLKGKSCFHIKTLDNKLIKQVEAAVKDGIDCYKKLQFI
jgi:hypothetical protein